MPKLRSLLLLLWIPLISLQGQGDVSVTVQSTTPVSCGDGSDGTITISMSGGSGDYSVLLLRSTTPVEAADSISTNSFTFTGHQRFTNYLIIVSDEDPVTADGLAWADITGPDPISISFFSSTDISCNGFNDGTINVSATGETGNYNFDLAGTASQSNTTGNFSGLGAGTYTVTVSDQNGCPSSDVTPVLTIANPTPVQISLDATTMVDCFGDNTGEISITPSGGTPGGGGTGYTYLWTGPNGYTSNQEDLSALEAGTYNVTVTDANGCSAMAGPFTLTQPPPLTAVLVSSTDVSCNGGADGTAQMTPGGGVGAYLYSWDGVNTGFVTTDQNPTNLPADTYNFTLMDGNACFRTFTNFAIIDEPAPLDVQLSSSTDVSCFGGSDGAAEISISGGTPPYVFSWTGATSAYVSSDQNPTGMPADTYTLEVSDDQGCLTSFPALLTIDEPPLLAAVLDGSVEVSCNGGADGSANITVSGGVPVYTFLWTGDNTGHSSGAEDPTDLVADTYDLLITDQNGCTRLYPDFVTITEPAIISVSVDNVVPVNCSGEGTGAINITPAGGTPPWNYAWTGPNGFTSTDQDLSGLEAGTYSLIISDSRGCFQEFVDLATVATNTPITASFVVQEANCQGVDGAITTTVSGGIPNYSYSWIGPGGVSSTSKDLTNIGTGDYALTVTDDLGCTAQFEVNVGAAPPISVNTVVQQIQCFGDMDGAIEITTVGGNPPYTFSWTGPNAFASSDEDLSGLEAGAYNLSISDSRGCIADFPNLAIISEPAEITATALASDISCNGAADGTIALTPGGGVSPYAFAWTGPGGFTSSDEDLSDLEAGSYSLSMTDDNGCVANFPSLATINEPAAILANLTSVTDIACAGESSGAAEIDVGGGIAPLAFSWTNASGQELSTQEDPSGLPAGTYSLRITDAKLCEVNYADFAVLSEPPALSLELSYNDPSCNGTTDGDLKLTGSGGKAPLRYSLNGGAYQASPNFNGLPAGTHLLSMLDQNGCTLDTSFSLVEPEVLSMVEASATDVQCFGANDGQIQITAQGGTAPLSYTLQPAGITQATGLFTGLAPAVNYTVEVNDSQNCGPVTSSILAIGEPSAMAVDSVEFTHLSCFESADGDISIFVNGGTPPYEYSADDGNSWQSEFLFQDLAAGSYKLYARDARGCMLDVGSQTLLQPPGMNLSISTTDILPCSGDSSGVISASGSGGTGLLQYSLDDIQYQASGVFDTLVAGDYTLYLRDDFGCQISEAVTLTEPEAVTAILVKTDASFGMLGSITFTESAGGTPPYEYSINNGSTFSSETAYPDLDTGLYQTIVRDALGCSYTQSVRIFDIIPMEVDLLISHVSCFGAGDGSIEFLPQDAEGPVRYSIDAGLTFGDEALIENLDGNTSYFLVAIDSAGKTFLDTVFLQEPAELMVSWTTMPAHCSDFSETGSIDVTVSGGTEDYTYLWSDGSTDPDRPAVSAGIHVLQTTDANLCTRSDSIEVTAEVTVLAHAGADTTICPGESMVLMGAGSHTPSWSNAHLLDNPDTLRPTVLGLTESTTFVLTISEDESIYGCRATDTVTIDLHPNAGIAVSKDTFIIRGGEVPISASGQNISSYRWEPESGLDNPNISNPIASPVESTLYTVFGNNEHGCTESASVLVEVITGVRAYNVFTPGGDGYNDFFEIENGARFPDMLVEVYSRWGDLLYSQVGYDEGNLWDGYARGKKVPTGTYYYILIPYDGATPVTGTVTVIWSENE